MLRIAIIIFSVVLLSVLPPPAFAAGCADNWSAQSQPKAVDFIKCMRELDSENADLKNSISELKCDLFLRIISERWKKLKYIIMEIDLAQIQIGGHIIEESQKLYENAKEYSYCARIKRNIEEIEILHKILIRYSTKSEDRRDVIDLLKDKTNKDFLDYRFLYGSHLHLAQLDSTPVDKRDNHWYLAKEYIKIAYKKSIESYNGPRKTYVIQRMKCASRDMKNATDEYISCMNALLGHSAGSVAYINLAQAYAIRAKTLMEDKGIEQDAKKKDIYKYMIKSIQFLEKFVALNNNICKKDIRQKAKEFSIFQGHTLEGKFSAVIKKIRC